MPSAELIVQTPRGSSIQKTEDGKFVVCNAENHCYFTRSLYLAEEELEGMERGYVFPYATNFRKSKTQGEHLDSESRQQRFDSERRQPFAP